MTDPVAIPRMAPRVAPVAVGLGLWFLTQSLLRYRPDGTGIRGDGLHTLTARIHVFLLSTRFRRVVEGRSALRPSHYLTPSSSAIVTAGSST
jgi:hypothetical protein